MLRSFYHFRCNFEILKSWVSRKHGQFSFGCKEWAIFRKTLGIARVEEKEKKWDIFSLIYRITDGKILTCWSSGSICLWTLLQYEIWASSSLPSQYCEEPILSWGQELISVKPSLTVRVRRPIIFSCVIWKTELIVFISMHDWESRLDWGKLRPKTNLHRPNLS